MTLGFPVFAPYTASTRYFAIAVLIAFNVFVFFSLKDIIIQVIRKWNFSLEYYPLLVSIYLLYSISVILTVQFDLKNINLIISIVYIIAAFSFIIFGFRKKYIFIRRFGLGLSVLSTGKLFIYDLAFLNTVGRIIAFFVFGFVLLLISFVYQKLGKYMEISNKSVEVR